MRAELTATSPKIPSAGRSSRDSAGRLLGLTILAFLLGFYRIGHDSFWTDEATSVRIADEAGWTRLWTVDHGNMFLYYGLLKVWLVVAKGEAAIRLFSLISFALIVPTVVMLGRRVRGDVVGLLAAALVATNPMLVLYGQEARAYSLVALLVTAAVLAVTVGLQDERRGALMVGIALLAASAYGHPVAVLTGGVVVVWLCTGESTVRSPRPGRWYSGCSSSASLRC